MSTIYQEETWEEFFKTNQSIPPHFSRTLNESEKSVAPSYSFCLTINSLELDFRSDVSDFLYLFSKKIILKIAVLK